MPSDLLLINYNFQKLNSPVFQPLHFLVVLLCFFFSSNSLKKFYCPLKEQIFSVLLKGMYFRKASALLNIFFVSFYFWGFSGLNVFASAALFSGYLFFWCTEKTKQSMISIS